RSPRCVTPTFISSLIYPIASHTYFPYTTLFRSVHAGDAQAVKLLYEPLFQGALPGKAAAWCFTALGLAALPQHTGAPEGLPAGGDRKSTRLNSSHVSISYAVFCLTKKKSKLVAG